MSKDESAKTVAAAARCQEKEQGMLDQLKQLQQNLMDENRQLRELLGTRLADPARPAEDAGLRRWEERRRAEAERIAAELLAGPLQFHVGHPGDPLRLVGAVDRAEAIEKYRRHFGILQTSHDFSVLQAAAGGAEA